MKSIHTVRTQSQIPSAIAEAWKSALTAPHGPVWVEIPQDVLLAETSLPVVTAVDATPEDLVPRPELTAVAADLLSKASRPAIIAGGGVIRADASKKLRQLAEKLQAPVVTTPGGKGAFPWTHPLSLQSWLEDRHTTDFLEDADVVLVVGSGLGELSSNYHTFKPRGRVIQIEADLGKLESNHPALGIHADAWHGLQALLETVTERTDPTAEARVAELLDRVRERIAAQELTLEQSVLASVRKALPPNSPSFWDMTILAYWAWSAFDAKGPNHLHSAQGAAASATASRRRWARRQPTRPARCWRCRGRRRPVLHRGVGHGQAVRPERHLAHRRRRRLRHPPRVHDGRVRRGHGDGTDPAGLRGTGGVVRGAGVRTTPEALEEDLAKSLAAPGPSVVVLPAVLRMFAATHLG